MKIKNRNRKGVVGFWLVFIIMSVLVLFLFGFAVPILIKFNTEIYSAGGDILNSINTSNLPQSANESIETARASTATQISALSFFYQYSWLIILIIVLFILFMRTRTTVETEIR